jgi:quercetin dioxygenase-like cupin family protein
MDDAVTALGVQIHHHFGGGTYAKETVIPAGVVLTQHRHAFDHLSILAAGTAAVDVGGLCRTLIGPACILIEAGKSHSVTAVTDVTWYCVHATDCTDPERVDDGLIEAGG